jgi:2-dehydro-3-deoxygluconokinase
VRRELTGHGVDCAHVVTLPGTRLGLYFVEYGVRPRPIRVVYDRRESAFARLTPEEVDWEPVRRARLVHLTGVTAALGEGGRALVRRALREAAAVSFDVNYRATLWSPTAARDFVTEVLPAVRYLSVGQGEAATIFGLDGSAEQVLEALAARAPAATITLMRGEEGSVVLEGGRTLRPRRRYQADLVDPIGAGDAYVGGFLSAVLRGDGLERAIEMATAVAALKCTTWGDIALIDQADVDDLLAGGPDVRR